MDNGKLKALSGDWLRLAHSIFSAVRWKQRMGLLLNFHSW
jgi:hypothetical protein